MKIYNPFKKISKLERELKDSLLDLDDLKSLGGREACV